MGTNYYWYKNTEKCKACGHDLAEIIHIGKSSGGWEFIFHGTDAIRSWADWQREFSQGGKILDEYGTEISPEKMSDIVSTRGENPRRNSDLSDRGWRDSELYPFLGTEFF